MNGPLKMRSNTHARTHARTHAHSVSPLRAHGRHTAQTRARTCAQSHAHTRTHDRFIAYFALVAMAGYSLIIGWELVKQWLPSEELPTFL